MMVYKYRGGNEKVFKRDLKALSENYFFAPNASDLNDPFESFVDLKPFKIGMGIFVNSFKIGEASVESFKNFENKFEGLLNRLDNMGIYSLSKSFDDELMWAHYANSHKGFCVEYDLDELLKPELPNNRYKIDVYYSKKMPNIDFHIMRRFDQSDKVMEFLQKKLGNKSRLWEHEKEIRVICDKQGENSYPKNAIKGIYFGANMSKLHKGKLINEMKDFKVNYFQMELAKDTYKLNVASI